MSRWYSRPIFLVADVPRAVAFYVDQLGFTEQWRYAEPNGDVLVAQVYRNDCEIMLACQWPAKNGKGMLFIELTSEGFAALPDELATKGVAFTNGYWGYPTVIVDDPDGNELYFPNPDAEPNQA